MAEKLQQFCSKFPEHKQGIDNKYFAEVSNFLKTNHDELLLSFEDDSNSRNNLELVWLRYAKSVRDYETVYRHMFTNKIGTSKASLYIDWAFMLEKYLRNFEAASLMFQTGLVNVVSDA